MGRRYTGNKSEDLQNKVEKLSVQESGPMTPIDNGTDVFSVYDPAVHLIDKYVDEAQVKDHKAIIAKTNYELFNIGPNYSNKASPQMLTLRFECPKMNNFYFDLEDDEGNAFNKNKDGTLRDINIYAGIAPSTVVTRWVDCNNPYEGYGHWESIKVKCIFLLFNISLI